MLCMKLYCTRVVLLAYFEKKASQKLINHFTEVKIFCLWCTFGPCFARVFEGDSSKFEARDSMSSGEIRCSLAPKQMPAIVFRAS